MSNNRNRKRRSGNPAVRAEAEQKIIDFDAIRAKRRRVLREVPPVTIGGKSYTLAPTLPLAVTEAFAEGSKTDGKGNMVAQIDLMVKLLAMLFGDDQWAEIAKVIDITDVPPLFGAVFDAYGEAVGESEHSGQS